MESLSPSSTQILVEVNGTTSSHFRDKLSVFNQRVKYVVSSLTKERGLLKNQVQELQDKVRHLEAALASQAAENSPASADQNIQIAALQAQIDYRNRQLDEQIRINQELRDEIDKIQQRTSRSSTQSLGNSEKKLIRMGFSLMKDKEEELVKLPVVMPSSPPPVQAVLSKRPTKASIDDTVATQWSDDEDTPDLIKVKDATTGNLLVKGGTVMKLIDHLCNHKSVEMGYVQAFLLTYRSFTTPVQLLEMLIAKYNFQVTTDGMSEPEKQKYESKRRIIKLRVGNVVRNWVEKYFFDFRDNPELVAKLHGFIDSQITTDMEALGASLKKTLAMEGQERDVQAKFDVDPPLSLLPKSTSFNDFPPLEVARQLTLIEFALYSKIKPAELLGKAWSKPERTTLSPNVVAITKNFNTISMWVATSIVKEEGFKERAGLIKKFIKIALHCKSLNNFNGVMEILAGLQSSAIHRLKKTWEKLETKYNELYNGLLNDMSSRDNYKNYREGLHSISPPCVPYLGVYLTDLTFIEDGNSDSLKDRPDMINFDKRRRLAAVIEELQRYQQQPYNLNEQPTVKDYLSHLEVLTEKLLYKFSLLCEPRVRETASSSSSQGWFSPKTVKRGKTFIE